MSIEKRFGYYEGSKESFVNSGLVESTPAEKITFILGEGDKGEAICARNKLFECGGGGSESGGGDGSPSGWPIVDLGSYFSSAVQMQPFTYYRCSNADESVFSRATESSDIMQEYILEIAGSAWDITLPDLVWKDDNALPMSWTASDDVYTIIHIRGDFAWWERNGVTKESNKAEVTSTAGLTSIYAYLNPDIMNIIRPDYVAGIEVDVTFNSLPTADEILQGAFHEYKMQLELTVSPDVDYVSSAPTISLPDNIFWANANAPTFEWGSIYQLSFTTSVNPYSSYVKLLGVWSKF